MFQLAVDGALALVQRCHLSLQTMQKWFDSAVALLQRTNAGVDLKNQADCSQEVDAVFTQEKSFTVALEELRTLISMMDFMEPGVMSEKIELMQQKHTEVKKQLEAYRKTLER